MQNFRLKIKGFLTIMTTIAPKPKERIHTSVALQPDEKGKHPHFLPNPVIFLLIFLPAVVITKNFDVFDIFVNWVRNDDVWYLDELTSMLILCLLPYMTYQSYRLFQMNRALTANEKTILSLHQTNEWILRAAGDGIFGLNREGKVIFVNPSAAHMLGSSIDHLMNNPFHDFTAPLVKKGPIPVPLAMEGTLKDGLPREQTDEFFRRQDGSLFPVEYTSTPMHHENQLTGVVVTFRDITERIRIQAEINRLAAAVRQAAEMVIIADPSGRILYANPAFETISGYACTEVIGKMASQIQSAPLSTEWTHTMIATISRGEVWRHRFLIPKKNGLLLHADMTISPVRDEKDEIIHYVAVARDVTHEVELGRQLRKSQRLEAVGTLAGGIAHDFNNILTAILSYTELTMDELDPHSIGHDNLAEVLVAANRARDLIKQLLIFSRRGERERVPMFLSGVVMEAIQLLKAVLPANVRLETSLDPEEISILADSTQIHQVVMNLCTNALEAMFHQGGSLKVQLNQERVDPSMLDHHPSLTQLTSRHCMVLSVEDQGTGIANDKLDRIFEPFYSTKNIGKGSGLGLSVVHGIVQNHQGVVIVSSKVNTGSTFRVFFPEFQEPAQ